MVGGYFNVDDNVISVIIPSLYHYLRPAGNRGIPPFLAVACLCISDKLGDIQFIVRKTRDRISIHYLSPEWRSLDRIAKFASTIPTTGARYANSMGSRLAFGAEREFAGAISVLNATMARHKVIAVYTATPT